MYFKVYNSYINNKQIAIFKKTILIFYYFSGKYYVLINLLDVNI